MALIKLSETWAQLQAFIARRDNPHKVTASQAGAYTRDEVDTKLSGYIPVGVLPLTAWNANGSAGVNFVVTTAGAITVIPYVGSDYVTINGRKYTFTAKQYAFTISKGQTVYIYFTCKSPSSAAGMVAEMTTTPRADTYDSFYVGSVRWTGDEPAVVEKFNEVVMLDGFRLSSIRRGGSIPVSTGLPTDKGTFNWS